MEEPQFGKKLAERMWKIEGLFAEAKQCHCLSRAKYRGRSKVQIQAYLCAMVQNLKRLLFRPELRDVRLVVEHLLKCGLIMEQEAIQHEIRNK